MEVLYILPIQNPLGQSTNNHNQERLRLMAKPDHPSRPLPGQTVLPDQNPKRQHSDLERVFLVQRRHRTGTTGVDSDDSGVVESRVGVWEFGVAEGSVESLGGADH